MKIENQKIRLDFAQIARVPVDLPDGFSGLVKLTLVTANESPAGDRALYHYNLTDDSGASLARGVWNFAGGCINAATKDKKPWWCQVVLAPGRQYTLELFSPEAPAIVEFRPNLTKM